MACPRREEDKDDVLRGSGLSLVPFSINLASSYSIMGRHASHAAWKDPLCKTTCLPTGFLTESMKTAALGRSSSLVPARLTASFALIQLGISSMFLALVTRKSSHAV